MVAVEATSGENPCATANFQKETAAVHRIVLSASLLVVLFNTIAAFAAEPIVIDLWPGKPPRGRRHQGTGDQPDLSIAPRRARPS